MEEKLEKKLRGGVGDGFAEIPDEALVDASGGQTTPKPPGYAIECGRPIWRCASCGNKVYDKWNRPEKCNSCGSTSFVADPNTDRGARL